MRRIPPAIAAATCGILLFLCGCPAAQTEVAGSSVDPSENLLDTLQGFDPDASSAADGSALSQPDGADELIALRRRDSDGDGRNDLDELTGGFDPLNPTDGPDIDGDKVPNAQDPDVDGDHIPNAYDDDIDGDQ